MDIFLSQLREFFSQDYVQFLLGVFVVTQAFWWLRVLVARQHPAYETPFKGSYAVVVAVDRTSPAALEKTLKSILASSKPTEFIVVVNNAPRAARRIKNIADKYADKVVELPTRLGEREYYAHAAGALKKKADVVIVASPEATWNESTVKILYPFADEHVGAVAVHTSFDPQNGFAARLHAAAVAPQHKVIMPFESYFGALTLLSAPTFAVRRAAFKRAVAAVRTETFFGRQLLQGFVYSLTSAVIAQGYRVVSQRAAHVVMPAPLGIAELFRKRLNESRSELRRFFRHFRTMIRLPFLVTLGVLGSLFGYAIYLSLIAVAAFMLVFGVYSFRIDMPPANWLALAALFIVGTSLVLFVRSLPYLRSRGLTALTLPFYALMSSILSLAAQAVAAFSFSENDKRVIVPSAYGEGKIGRPRVVAFVTGLAVMVGALLATYATLIHTQGIPFTTIVANQGEVYAQAQKLGAHPSEPSDAEIAALIAENSRHYNQTINDTLVAAATPCVRDLLKQNRNPAPLNEIHGCYASALAAAEASKNQPTPPPPVPPSITITAKRGDTLTHLVRAQIKQKDTGHTLSAAQVVFIETTYLHKTGQQNHFLGVAEVVTIDPIKLDMLIAQAKQMPAEQLAAWDHYAAQIIY